MYIYSSTDPQFESTQKWLTQIVSNWHKWEVSIYWFIFGDNDEPKIETSRLDGQLLKLTGNVLNSAARMDT